MITITLQMKAGGLMIVEADGHCVHDKSGSGEPVQYVEDLTCFWPGKQKTRREIPVHLYNVEKAEEDFWCATSRI